MPDSPAPRMGDVEYKAGDHVQISRACFPTGSATIVQVREGYVMVRMDGDNFDTLFGWAAIEGLAS